MEEFKIGDTVMVLGNECGSINEVGDTGIVTIVDGSIQVQVKGKPNHTNWHTHKELKLVERKIDEEVLEYKTNAEEDYLKVPISVLRYISILESKLGIIDLEEN